MSIYKHFLRFTLKKRGIVFLTFASPYYGQAQKNVQTINWFARFFSKSGSSPDAILIAVPLRRGVRADLSPQ